VNIAKASWLCAKSASAAPEETRDARVMPDLPAPTG
jgi:hypothetical protein